MIDGNEEIVEKIKKYLVDNLSSLEELNKEFITQFKSKEDDLRKEITNDETIKSIVNGNESIVETMGTDIREFLKYKKTDDRNIIWVTHGLFGRTAYSFYNHTTDTPYELINSKNIQFRNLDMMKIEPSTGKTEIYRL